MAFYTICALLVLHAVITSTSSSWAFAADKNDECTTPKFEHGTCIPIKECAELYAILLRPRPLPTDLVHYLSQSQCGFQDRQPLVCCPDGNDFTPATRPPTARPPTARPPTARPPTARPPTAKPPTARPPTGTPPNPPTSVATVKDVSKHPNIGLINPEYCGQSSASKIVGGNKTSIYEFPWMTLLSYRSRGRVSFKCGGSLISSRWVLTAAHCVATRKDNTLVSVRVGDHDTSKEKDCEDHSGTLVCAPPPQDIDVEKTIVHPQYSNSKITNDIALVRLSRPVERRENAQPICLPVGLPEQTKTFDNKKLIVAGWGATETGSSSSPDLLKVSVPVVPVSKCNDIYKSLKFTVGPNQLCAGGSNLKQDSCNGDSGGPLKTVGEVAGESSIVQYGIVSFGPRRCGTENVPGVYTRVGHYMDWILSQLYP